MSLTVQNLRAVGTGVEPASLLPGQIAFNITDKVLYVGDGSNFKTQFDGTQVAGTPGAGWYAMPMDFGALGNYYVANPEVYGDVPTDQQVLTWSDALDHPIWTTGSGAGGNQVYVVTNAQVASASGATTSDKITTAIGVASPDEGDVTIVTGLPDDVYEGLYFFTTSWVKGAAYAYPSASEVIYDNTGRTIGATVQAAIDDLDDGLIATTSIANTANSTANSALSIASAALPRAGGTMTGTIVSQNINVPTGFGVQFNAGAAGTINGINDSINATSSTVAASGTAVKTAYDIGAAALARSGGTMTGAITFAAGQLFPISGIDIATTSQLGVVRVGTNIQVASGVISILDSTTSNKGVVQLFDALVGGTVTTALTARAGSDLQSQIDSLTLASNVFLAGSLDASTGLIDSVTSLGGATVPPFVPGAGLPSPQLSLADYYVLVTTAGSYSPPLSGGPFLAEPGDWFLCGETFLGSGVYVWQYLGVGARPQSASYTTAGIVQLADTAVTYTGTSDTEAITPNSLQDKVSDSTSLADSQRIASSVAVKSAYDLAAAAIPCSVVVGKGAIVTGSAAGVPTALPLGTTGQVLIVNTATATGLEWVNDTPGDVTSVTATSPVTANNTDPQNPIIGINAASTTQAGAVQLNDTVTSTSTTEAATANALKGVYDIASAAVPCASFLATGNLLAGTGAGTYSALTVGSNGQVLLANSACSAGLEWGNADYVPDACFTAAGDIIVGTGAGTYVALPVGTNGQALVVDSACTSGVKWGAALEGFTQGSALFNTAIGVNAGCSLTTGCQNVLLGAGAGDCLTTGFRNIAIGYNALGGSLSGSICETIAIGYEAGGCLYGGSQNVIIGDCSGYKITSGFCNVILGDCAGCALTAGASNTLIGAGAASSATAFTSNGNTGVGSRALHKITSGGSNTSVGGDSAFALTTGACNAMLGSGAGFSLTTGCLNVFIGRLSGCGITTGGCNTVVGAYCTTVGGLSNNVVLADGVGTVKFQANNSGAWSPDGTNYGTIGQVLTSNGTVAAPTWNTLSLACVPCAAFVACGDLLVGTGSATFTALPTGANSQVLTVDTTCTATGGLKWVTPSSLCGYTDTAAPLNTALGFQAGDSITTGTDNVAIGYNAGTAITTGSQNVVIGSNTSVSSNAVGIVAIGFCAGQAVTTGGCVVHIGWVSGRNSTGLSNTYVGALTGCAASNTSACGTLLGFCAGAALTTGNANTFLGFNSGRSTTTGTFNVALGAASFQSGTGSCNIAIGCGALSGSAAGAANVAIGHRAMLNATTAANNVAIGLESGVQLSTGSNNTFVGISSGDTVTTGVQNTFLGACSGGTVATGSEGNTAVGFSALGQGVTSGGYNVALGHSAGQSVTSGGGNTFVGFQSGAGITTGIQNTFVGRYSGTAAMANNVVLADGAGTVRFQANATGAWSPNGTNFGTAGQVLKSAGTGAAPAWSSALYGAFSDSSIQTNDDLVNGNAVTLDTTASSNGFSIVSGSQITATTAGVYNIQISLQVEKTDAGADNVEVWFKKSGTDIANSNTNIELSGNGAKQLFALNLVEPLTAGQYLEVWWYSADANVQLTSVAAGTRPAIPSAIVTVVPVGA